MKAGTQVAHARGNLLYQHRLGPAVYATLCGRTDSAHSYVAADGAVTCKGCLRAAAFATEKEAA